MNITIHRTGSLGNLYQVDNLIIDPGVPVKEVKEKLNYQLSNIAGCLVSHSHMDHAKGLKDLLQCGIDCYVSKETAGSLNLSGHRVHIIEPFKQFNIGSWKIKAFPLVHDVPNLGFLMACNGSKVLYCCDTNYVPPRFRGLTHILLGVSYSNEILEDNITCGHVNPELGKRIFKNHLSLRTAIGFFQANDMSKVQEIYLIHLSDRNSNAELFRNEIAGITGKAVYA